MPYMAVQCSSCGMLQGKEVRKSSSTSKWSCTICNQKQSVRKVYTTSASAKEVRNFVQKFNLTIGLAAEAEATAMLEGAAADTVEEDPSVNDRDQEEENYYCDQEEEDLRLVRDAREKKNSFKCAQQFLPEEQGCSQDTFQEPFDENQFVTSLPDPPSRTRQSYSSQGNCSPPPHPQKTTYGLAASRGDAKRGNLVPLLNKDRASNNSVPDFLFKLKRGRNSGSDGSTPLYQSLNHSARPAEVTSCALPASDTDSSPKKAKPCHAHVSVQPTSKWSKYLT